YEVSIWWEKPADAPLHLNYFLSQVAGAPAVRAQCDVAWNPLDATNAATPPPNLEELRQIVGSRTSEALEAIGFQGPLQQREPAREEEGWQITVELQRQAAAAEASRQTARRRKAAEQIRDAILAAFPQPTA